MFAIKTIPSGQNIDFKPSRFALEESVGLFYLLQTANQMLLSMKHLTWCLEFCQMITLLPELFFWRNGHLGIFLIIIQDISKKSPTNPSQCFAPFSLDVP